ncbi:MAG: hypothetical protein RIE32_05730 [Phycisphaerales bacterium]
MGQNGQDGARSLSGIDPCCVLWTPPGEHPPRELLASLQRRNLAWVGVQDGYSAMTEILLRRRAGGGPRSAVLVLVHPTKLDLSGLVVDALARFTGPVAVWRFDPDAQPVLAAAQRHELATVFVRTQEEESRPARTAGNRPQTPQTNAQPRPQPEEDEPTASSILSEEELSMLLADRSERSGR